MTTPDRLVFFSRAEEATGMMKLDFAADPLTKPDPPDISGWEEVMVAGTSGWMKITQGGEASGPYDVWITVYIPGLEYRYMLSLLCAPAGGTEETREQFIEECQRILQHILGTFRIAP
jgi:hypothetical protein